MESSPMSVDAEGSPVKYTPPVVLQALRRPYDTIKVIAENPVLISTPSLTGNKRSRRDGDQVNPFEKHLLDRLQKSIWSPSILGDVAMETPPQKSWAIDQIALLNPTKIEDSPSTHQNERILTPMTEARAQEAIGRFFSQSSVVPSPQSSPVSSNSNSNSNWASDKLGNNSKMVNTDLSFPPILPPQVEQILDSYTTDMNTSITRRKLEFSFEESSDSGEESNGVEARVPRSGMIIHSPGTESSHATSPRHSRIGMKSPASTPIRG